MSARGKKPIDKKSVKWCAEGESAVCEATQKRNSASCHGPFSPFPFFFFSSPPFPGGKRGGTYQSYLRSLQNLDGAGFDNRIFPFPDFKHFTSQRLPSLFFIKWLFYSVNSVPNQPFFSPVLPRDPFLPAAHKGGFGSAVEGREDQTSGKEPNSGLIRPEKKVDGLRKIK